MSTLHDFARRREQGARQLQALAEVVRGAPVASAEAAEALDTLAARARAGRFHVLLVGCFSSGKSTLLNALLGQPVLPVKVNPCTAILTELVHGEAPEVTVRHRNGRQEHLSPDDFLRAYQLRAVEAEQAGAEATDRFGGVDRAVVAWPLPLLRDGVVLVDTPGLDDDEARTARTLSSIPEADAVIVVLNASRFLTDLERRLLRRELLPQGLTNLFFPVTMADLLHALSDQPEREREELLQRARRTLGPLCAPDGVDRFDDRFFLLDARGALTARYDRDQKRRRDPPDELALQASGMAAFEAALESFLVHERGQAQLAHLGVVARRVRDDLARQAALDRATANASVDELRGRQEALQPRFAELEAIAARVGRVVDAFVKRQQQVVWQDLRDFLAQAERELPEAVAGFDLGGLAGLDLLRPKGRERVEAVLREQLEAWLAERVGLWQQQLRPRLEAALADLQDQLAAEGRDFDAVAEAIVGGFSGRIVSVPEGEGGAEEPGAAERWFSVALGAALLSPGTMAAGWTEGYEGAMKGAAGRLGARLAVLALGALLGPVGWAAILLYLVSDAVLLAITGGGQLKRLREQVARDLQGQLVAQADATRDEVMAQVAEGLRPLRDALVGAAEDEAGRLREQLQHTIAARAQAARDAQAREGAWDALLAELDRGVEALEALVRPEAAG